MGTFPFVSAHQRVALCAMCRQFTGGCSGATPVALPSRVPVAAGDRPVASGLQPRLHIQSCHACEDCEPSPSPGAQGALGPHQRRLRGSLVSPQHRSSGSAAATQADCCVGFYGEKTRGICGAREEAKAHLNILGHPGNVIGSEKNHADGMYKASPRGYSL